MSDRIPCPDCGYKNSQYRVTCKKCRVTLKDVPFEDTQQVATVDKKLPLGKELSLQERSDILSQEIKRYVKRGYRVLSKTDTTVQLVKPKEFSFFWALLWFFLWGIGILVYLFYYMSKKDSAVYLEVLPNGLVVRQ